MDGSSREATRHERVLLVEDDPDIRDFIERRTFRDRGFDDITTADDGEAGLELIELPRR